MITTILNDKKAMEKENAMTQEPKKAGWWKRNWKKVLGLGALLGATAILSNKQTREATIAAGKRAYDAAKTGAGKLVDKVRGNKTQVNDQAIPTSEPIQARDYNNRNRDNRNWNNNQQRNPKFN
jgi:hypothetical protein